MDPKVCGKLLTHHRRGYGVDVEALHDRFPLRNKHDLGDLEWTSSNKRGGYEGARRAPHPRGPLEHQPAYLLRLYILPYPKNIRGDHEKLFPPP